MAHHRMAAGIARGDESLIESMSCLINDLYAAQKWLERSDDREQALVAIRAANACALEIAARLFGQSIREPSDITGDGSAVNTLVHQAKDHP